MDLLYPLVNSPFGNTELLFSLRMIEKHAKGVGNVFIIGDKPDFVNDNVRHFYFNETGVKDYRIAKKIEFACGIEELSENFLFLNDDHFFTKDFEISEYPYYHKGDLGVEKPIVEYQKYLNSTKAMLFGLGKGTKHFDVHCPIIYNKTKFLELSHIWNEQKSYVVKSTYANYHGIEGELYKDCKLKSLRTESDFEKATKNVCFSIYDSAMQFGAMKWLAENYPNPSRWEKEDYKFKIKVLQGFNDSKEKVFRGTGKVFEADNERTMELLYKAPKGYLKLE